MAAGPDAGRRPFELRFAIGLFVALLAFHAWGVSVGISQRTLPGNEFRQTQTAISALFIQRGNDFSLAYPTPVLGKPWAVPFEFPLYQWTVVVVSNTFKLNLTVAARVVSAACFYLTLPALWLLLRRLGVSPLVRWVALCFVVSCPLYIFYSRAFLIETMALMASAWFLVGYVFAVERRTISWLLLANCAGILAGLVKVTTFMLFLMPAFLWSLAWIWKDWSAGTSGRVSAIFKRVGWISLSLILPFVATYAWLQFADHTKAENPAGKYLVSSSMTSYNFGSAETRFAPEIWKPHFIIIGREIASYALLAAAGLIALIWGRRSWRITGISVAIFFAVQLLFPILYAWHEYYWVANAGFLMVAVGLALGSLLESRLKWGIAWLAIVCAVGAQVFKYVRFYLPSQQVDYASAGGLAEALRNYTKPNDVLIIAGDDWSSMLPYYSQRPAFMLRRNMEKNWEMIHNGFLKLDGESVRVLILRGDQRDNTELVKMAHSYYHINEEPVLTWEDCVVYMREDLASLISSAMPYDTFFGVKVVPRAGESDPGLKAEVEVAKLSPRRQAIFAAMSPRPVRYYTTFGIDLGTEFGRPYLVAHPDTRLWFQVPAGKRHIEAEFMLASGAYEGVSAGDATDGVEYTIYERKSDGELRKIYARTINPRDVPEDRGAQKITVDTEVSAGSDLLFAIGPGPNGNYSRDWASMGPIQIR
jgi:hypothetical protein